MTNVRSEQENDLQPSHSATVIHQFRLYLVPKVSKVGARSVYQGWELHRKDAIA